MTGAEMASTNPIGVVLTGGDFMALGVLRTLASKKIPILLLEHEHSISRYSIYPKRVVKSPSPADPEAYAHFLVSVARKEGVTGWVVFPNSDEIVYALSRYRDLLAPHFRLPTPCWEIIQNVHIKRNTYQLATKLGIPIPATHYPASLEEAASLDIPFPAVIKPSIRDHYYSRVKTKAYRVNSREELIRVYRQVSEVIPPSEILVQDLIPGGPRALYSYCPF
jgi:predicted ATP-grasp superfamily ATP-dependent carboligase